MTKLTLRQKYRGFGERPNPRKQAELHEAVFKQLVENCPQCRGRVRPGARRAPPGAPAE